MPTRSSDLKRLFPLLLASVASVAACGGTTGSSPEPAPQPVTPPLPPVDSGGEFPLLVQCLTEDTRWSVATPSPSFDGFEIRRAEPGATGVSKVVRTVAELCSAATDKAACKAKTANDGRQGWDPWGGADLGPRQSTPELAIATTKDEVLTIATVEDLGTALAPIETVDEAAILLALRGYMPKCEAGAAAPVGRLAGGAFELILQTSGSCGAVVKEAVWRVESDGRVTMISQKELGRPAAGGPVCGRRPATLSLSAALDPGATVGALLARMAYLEAASVPAFAILARDLARLDAPLTLRKRVERARQDEVRHARQMRAAARRHGAEPVTPRVGRGAPRTLFAVALENAVEGCVREMFGALVASHQARNASDPELAALFASIAADETEHAALSWDLAEWFDTQLSASERLRLADARVAAVAELNASLVDDPSSHEMRSAGMPSARTARALLGAMNEALALLAA